MPLRDHFHSPVDDIISWEGFHGQWPAMIVLNLTRRLPRRFVAAPRVHSGQFIEIDVGTFEKDEAELPSWEAPNDNGGGVATAVWAPPTPTLAVATDLPAQDEYEVRVYDAKRRHRLVAAIEIVSPGNKDRAGSRRTFAAKCAGYLKHGIGLAVIDVVTSRSANLHEELFEVLSWAQLGLHDKPCGLLDVDRYYQPLLAFLDGGVATGFIKPKHRALLIVESDAGNLLDRFEEKWRARSPKPFDATIT